MTSAAQSAYPISPDFEWIPDYDALLEQIASTDSVDAEWSRLRDIIKYKVDKNVGAFITQAIERAQHPQSPRTAAKQPETQGGLWLPPFGPRPRNEFARNEVPRVHLTETEAHEQKELIYSQLHEFEGPPFTIQRICELCLRPTQHYNASGKYLRAVEKSLLVTSTHDAFPPISPTTSTVLPGVSGAALIGAGASAPATPLFSPIPFLHDDARRSTSRSPPPLALEPAADLSTPAVAGAEGATGAAAEAPRALGMVDELDDPGPGHMSDAPTALSAVTTLPAEGIQAGAEATTNGTTSPSSTARGTGRPLLGSLGDRFVAGGQDNTQGPDDMDLDDTEAEDKENRA